MSLASPFAPPPVLAARPLEDQAHSLVEFLSAHSHALTAELAARVLAGLTEDPKAAAKELRARLAGVGIHIKHTHALKAVAEARGATGHLGLGGATRWDVAAWFADAPAVSANRKLHPRLADAADDICQRVREVFEDYEEEPHVQAALHEGYLELTTFSAPAPFWHLLLVATEGDGSVAVFARAEQRRLVERLRRLVEGELGGWLDGCFDFETLQTESRFGLGRESGLIELTQAAAEGGSLPEVPPTVLMGDGTRPSYPDWEALRRRHAAFVRRHPDQTPGEWFEEHEASHEDHRFEDEPFNVGVFESARIRDGHSVERLATLAGLKLDELRDMLRDCRMPTHKFVKFTQLLALDTPNDLLDEPRTTPRIPMLSADELSTWLARIDSEVVDYDDAPAVPAELRRQLVALTQVPFDRRRAWVKATPAAVKGFFQEAERAGRVVCAAMTKRFVQDLPLGRWRLGMVAVLSFELESVVRSQPGLERQEPAVDSDEDDEVKESITPEWLARFNEPSFTGEELLKLSSEVERRREQKSSDNFDIALFTAARHFRGQPGKGHAATTRLEAVSRLIQQHSLEPWVLKSPEDGASMLSRPVFEAAARCPLVDVDGRAGFDFKTFYMICVEHAREEDASR